MNNIDLIPVFVLMKPVVVTTVLFNPVGHFFLFLINALNEAAGYDA